MHSLKDRFKTGSCCILAVLNMTVGTVVAGGLQDLEDVTVRVLDLNEVPDDSVELIQLPEPDLGEMVDRVESIHLPGKPALQREIVDNNGDNARETSPPTTAPVPAVPTSGASQVPPTDSQKNP